MDTLIAARPPTEAAMPAAEAGLVNEDDALAFLASQGFPDHTRR